MGVRKRGSDQDLPQERLAGAYCFCWLKAKAIVLKGSTCDNGHPGCVSGVVNRTSVH